MDEDPYLRDHAGLATHSRRTPSASTNSTLNVMALLGAPISTLPTFLAVALPSRSLLTNTSVLLAAVAALLALLTISAQTSPPADGEAEKVASSEEPAGSDNPTEAEPHGETTEEASPDTTADSHGDPSKKSEEHTDAPSNLKGKDGKDAKKKSSSHYLTAFPLAMGAGFVIAQQLL